MARYSPRDFDGRVLSDRTHYLWFPSAAEIEKRLTFVAQLSLAEGELSHIVGAYHVPADQPIRCGLNRCNQPHQKGFLIANKAGQETICGNMCGRRKLGLVFKELASRFQATANEAMLQEKLADLRQNANEKLDTVSRLERELKLVYGPLKEIRQQFRQERTADRLITVLMRQGGAITRQRELSQRERDISGNSKVRFATESIGFVRSVAVLDSYPRIANLLANDLRGKIEEVQRLDAVSDIRGRKLSGYASAIQRMPGIEEEVSLFLKNAGDFLQPANFEELTKLLVMDQANARRLQPILDKIRIHFGTRSTPA